MTVVVGIVLFALTSFHAGDELENENHRANEIEIGIYSTELTMKDNYEVIIPNISFLSQINVNNSANPIRLLDLVVRVRYEANLMDVRDILWSLLSQDAWILNEPEPKINISGLAESSVNLDVRPWMLTDDHGVVSDDLKEKTKLSFNEQEIQTRYPRLEIAAPGEGGNPSSSQDSFPVESKL